jgi:hypothetical protein
LSTQDKITVQLFYDGPLPADNPFEEFLELSDEKWINHELHDTADQKLAENFAFMDQLFSHIHDPSRVTAAPLDCPVNGTRLSLQTYAKNPSRAGVGEENVRYVIKQFPGCSSHSLLKGALGNCDGFALHPKALE